MKKGLLLQVSHYTLIKLAICCLQISDTDVNTPTPDTLLHLLTKQV